MALIKEINGILPSFGADCFLAENATILGDVQMGDLCSVWYSAVLRGDVHSIRMGNKVNVQDGAVIHATYQQSPTNIGNNVSIGHNAIVHGCTLHDNVLVGMGAIILDDAVIEPNCIIAAGAIVTKGTVVKENSLYLCKPDKKIIPLSEELRAGEIERIANSYATKYAPWHK